LMRIGAGEYASALDEFLAARVPLQLGGLHDPFTPRERDWGVTYELLKILHKHDQPTLISTKGELLLEDRYLSLLKEMNVVVRFSAAGVDEKYRAAIDRRCGDFSNTVRKIERLSKVGVDTGLRIQPVIPGFEADAFTMTHKAAQAGVKQVSFEYLKLATESLRSDTRLLKEATGLDVFGLMRSLGLTALGWDYTLSAAPKREFVREARKVCRKLGLHFGAGDTEFIPWSDGDGCCGSSSTFLKKSQQFSANFVGAIKSGVRTETKNIQFGQVERAWSPSRPISTYLNRRSRGVANDGTRSDWVALMANRWNGDSGPYSPTFFDGVEWTGSVNRNGFRIYDASKLALELNR